MVISDRNKYRYLYNFVIAAILPLSMGIIINPQPLTAQETRVENTVIYVDAQTGNDRNQGTRNTPLQTITQALKIARPNTIISLAPGTYSEASGETFPLIIKNNVTLKGLTGGQGHSVIIKGSGTFLSPTAAAQNVTIAAIKNAGAITGVTVTNPHNRGHGLWIESANPQVSDSSFTRNGNTGLSVNGSSKPIIANNYFFNNGGNGLLIYGTSAPQVKDNLFENTGFAVSIVQNAAPILDNNTFKGNRIGVILEGSSQGILRNNTITNSLEYGLVAIAQSKVDLGVSNKPGNNTFSNNKKLDIQNVTDNVISATGTTFNGQTEGKIDFSKNAISSVSVDEVLASSSDLQRSNFSRLRKNPLPNNISKQTDRAIAVSSSQLPDSNPSVTNPPVTNQETLPPPPPVVNSSSQSTGKEYVFSAPQADEVNNNEVNNINNNVATNISNSNRKPPVSSTIKSSSLSNNINSNNISSLSDVLGTSASSVSSASSAIKYRVLVEASNSGQQARVKSLYPDAFNIVYQGKSMLQVGAFSDRSKAEIASRDLADLGFNSYVLE